MSKRVLVAMSGGMDSAVAAALLKTQGYDVTGVHVQLWERSEAKDLTGTGCCQTWVDPDKVKAICAQLEIPFKLVHARELYQHEVIDYVVHECLVARVPNPCVRCTCVVKFPMLLKAADDFKCEFVATGHYAKVVRNAEGTETNIYRATDEEFDQSYFLFGLKQAQLSRVLMPLGDLLEANVRKMAKTFKLPVVQKEPVRRICYVEDTTHRELVEARVPDRYRPGGMIVDSEGQALGRHIGLHYYRLAARKVPGVEKPEWIDKCVVGFDVRLNAVILGEPRDLHQSSLVATDCNWIGIQDFSRGLRARARIRAYHHEPADCIVTLLNNNSVRVDFEKPQLAITPGQAIVFYQEDILVGGGWIHGLSTPIGTKLNKRVAFTISSKEKEL